ncbi:hypothetical protein LOK49_LG14G00015 [Camellia lanceoleosa]|uniref:Uncharacterized protein n=1 Tax=Camellia lanceoleosa TaxID=1840588 RepID=A0ACC0F8V2_9ERIC|nr:hypothetical protein LOK49_LG14G00015 [Camellia lanceoleosa]
MESVRCSTSRLAICSTPCLTEARYSCPFHMVGKSQDRDPGVENPHLLHQGNYATCPPVDIKVEDLNLTSSLTKQPNTTWHIRKELEFKSVRGLKEQEFYSMMSTGVHFLFAHYYTEDIGQVLE